MRRPVRHSVALLQHGHDLGVLGKTASRYLGYKLVDRPPVGALDVAQLRLDFFLGSWHGGVSWLKRRRSSSPRSALFRVRLPLEGLFGRLGLSAWDHPEGPHDRQMT